MDHETYFITNKRNKILTKQHFIEIVSNMVSDQGLIRLAELNNSLTLTLHKGDIVVSSTELDFSEAGNGKITVKIGKNDFSILHAIRNTCMHNDLRVFNLNLGVYLPISIQLEEIKVMRLPENYKELLEKVKLTPIYMYENRTIYVLDRNKKVHILNSYLFDYFLTWSQHETIPENELAELYYQVAENLSEFTSFFNAGLIPTNFYEYYKKPQKIINNSFININNPGRKIFVKPLVYEFESEWNEFYMRITEQGNQILMDKILPGETLDSTLKRVLALLNLKEDYVRALVLPQLEFDRDKQNIITPRLIVHVYINKMTKIPDVLKRGWVPITN